MGVDEDRGGRIEYLDVLRGVAILSILPVNAAFFAYPVTVAGDPAFPPGAGAADAAADLGVRALFEYKFHTLFALLFGAGMALLRARTRERGARWGPLAARRLGFLWVLGCAHGVLLWYGDIAAVYALLGLALCWAPGLPPRLLRALGAALLALPVALLVLLLAALLADVGGISQVVSGWLAPTFPDGVDPGWQAGPGGGFGRQLLEFDPDFEIAVVREGSFAQATALRGFTWALSWLVSGPYWAPRLAGLFLLGMAWTGEGWFLAPASAEGARRFRRLLAWGAGAGVPLTAAAILLQGIAPRDPAAAVGGEIAHYLGSLGLAGAYAALLARACAAAPGHPWLRALAAAGRMAFTNYLAQSAVMALLFQGTTVFLGAGLGLFASVGRGTLLFLALAVGLAQVVASVLWLRAFRVGPVEWVWRAATYLRITPLLRRAAPT